MALPATSDADEVAGRPPLRAVDGVLQLPVAEVRPYTMLDNSYLDEAMAALSGAAWKCLCFLIRQTTGFHASEVRLSLSAFCDGVRKADGSILSRGTGLSKPAVIAALEDLQQAHIIYRSQEASRTAVPAYGLEPLTSWRLADLACKKSLQAGSACQNTLQADAPASKKSLQAAASASKKSLPIKEIPEERNTRGKKTDGSDAPLGASSAPAASSSSAPSSAPVPAEQKKPAKQVKRFAADSLEMFLAIHIRDKIRAWLPNGSLPEKAGDPRWQSWARSVDEMLRIDHRTPAQIRALIDALAREKHMAFWREHVQSPAKLRAKWDSLETRFREHGGKLPAGPAQPAPVSSAEAPARQQGSTTSNRNIEKLLAQASRSSASAARPPEGGSQ